MFTVREPFDLLTKESAELERLVRSTRVFARLSRRARALLLLASGSSLRHIQAQPGLSPRRTLHWKQCGRNRVLEGLLDARRSGRPQKTTAVKQAVIVAATQAAPPGLLTHSSTGRLVRRWGVSHVTVMRLWHKVGLQPHPCGTIWPVPIPILKLRPKTSTACISNSQKTPRFSASTRRPPSRPWIVSSRPCPFEPDARNGTRSNTCGAEPFRYFWPWRCTVGRCAGRCARPYTSEAFDDFPDEALARIDVRPTA